MKSRSQVVSIFNIIIKVENPDKDFKKELERASKSGDFMYIDRFIYGCPELVMPQDNGDLIVCVVPMPDLLDPWAVTQDLKDELEEADNNGEFSDDPIE